MIVTNSQIKNLGFSIFLGIILLYVALVNYSWIGLTGAAVFIASIFLISMLYAKNDGILAKLDLYILFMVLALVCSQFETLRGSFDPNISFSGNSMWRYMILLTGVPLGIIISNNSNSRHPDQIEKTDQEKVITKYIGIFISIESLSFFLFNNATGSVFNIVIFAFFGFVKYCRMQLYSAKSASNSRCEWVAISLAAIVIIIKALFPAYPEPAVNLKGIFSVSVFPWYNVLAITLLLFAIAGAYTYFGGREKNFPNEDILFLSGLIGFVWVLKSVLYFYFDFYWLALLLYGFLFLAIMNRFITKRAGKKKPVQNRKFYQIIKENEPYLALIAAGAISLAVFMINRGYLAFCLSIFLSLITISLVHHNFSGWLKDAVYWQTVLLGIAVSGLLFTLQGGYSEKKIIIIAALFIFTSIIMGMMNHNNEIGSNKFKKTKIAITMIFGILILTAMLKSGAYIDASYTNIKANAGAFFREDTTLTITTKAKGKNNQITELKYIWAKSFFFAEDEATYLDNQEAELPIKNHHLIIWATDSNGVTTRKDRWFYKAPD
ncbi:MAG: hypothetical protein FWF85_04565 [Clostridiales bacterium]|nr:hypothetical protein [Clostridiales bacterium]